MNGAGSHLAKAAGLVRRLAGLRNGHWLNTPTPSADIYFLNGLGHLVRPQGAIVALGPNVFAANGRFVVARYANARELADLESAERKEVYYVIDDDIEALSRLETLPADYRARLSAFVSESLPRILKLDPVVLAPSELLLDRFAGHRRALIAPSYCSLASGFDHFERPERIEIVFAGTRSHLPDLEAVADALLRVCRRYPQVSLTTFLGPSAPRALRSLKGAAHRAPLPWPAYRRFMAAARFHIALAPFLPIPTNQCRSHNKIHDHAAFGAAGLYGDILPYRAALSHDRDGLLLPPDPDPWFEHLSRLVEDPSLAEALARRGAELSRKLGDPARLRSFWLERLDLPASR